MSKSRKIRGQSQKKTAGKKSFLPWKWGILAAVLVVVGVVIFLVSRQGVTSPSSRVSAAEATERQANGAIILDVRDPEEWAQGHIPDAMHIPLGDLPERMDEIPRDTEVIIVCRTGNRSTQGKNILLAAGFTDVSILSGGMTLWQAQGLETVSGE